MRAPTMCPARLLIPVLLTLLTCTFVLIGPARADAASDRETRMVTRINAARAAHGLVPLTASRELVGAARSHSRSMASERALFHTSTFAPLCCWSAVAENVAYGNGVTRLHRMLMASPGHRTNILDPRMTKVGVGIISSGGYLWVTEVFRRPRG